MDFAALSVRRPVLTIVVSLVIVVFGAIGFTRLGVREFPAVDPPTISVSTTYPGAAAEVIEAQITEPLEQAINSVAGLQTVSSVSREGSSVITAEFSLDSDLDAVASDVRDQLARAVRSLPPDCNPPILTKSNADSTPIFGLVLRSEDRSPLELSALADRLKEQLQTVPGVAAVDQPGERRYAMRLWIDPAKLAAYGLSPLDVRNALQRENIELPSGRIEGASVEMPVKTLSRLRTPAEFDALIVKRDGDRIVRFRDVGYAELGALNERASLKAGLTPVAGLFFRPQPGANQVDIVDAIHTRLDRLRADLPSDVTVEVFFDNTEFVRRSIAEVEETILIAFGLVLMVVFAFLREWRSTLIPVVAIPVSIIGTFSLLAAAGFSINTLTLLGIVLAIGLVVDDAIVVLENIHAKVERGMPTREAAIAGTREIFLAVIATTIVLAVVFLPLLFLGGLSGRLFREFGVTIAGAVLISALVALTLTPMLCARLLARHGKRSWLHRATEPLFTRLEEAYARNLSLVLRHVWLAPLALCAAGGLAWLAFRALPRELVPLEDRGRVWVRATAPDGASFEYTEAFMDDLTAIVAERAPEARLMLTQLPSFGGGGPGPVNSGHVRIFLPERSARQRSQQDIVDDLQKAVRGLSEARVNITQEASIGDRRSALGGLQMVILASSLDAIGEAQERFLEQVRKSPVFTFVDTNLKFNKPELRVQIDRDKAQALGVSAAEIAQTLQATLSGQRFGYFILNGKQYEVIGQVTRDFRSRPGDLGNITVRTPSGVVRLDNLVQLTETSAPPELYRHNRSSAATISGTLARGATLGDGIAAFEAAARATLDERFTTELTGSARDFVASSSSLGWVFALAVLLIYLVLAAQFESFRDPFIIMLTVPLALAGALAGLWYFGQSLNIYSQIGLIMLVGLITKNGILIVEFANQRRESGVRDSMTAVHQAAVARLRPILMTTIATILGALPIALALGAGAESRVSMGVAVICGLASGGALTLFVIPPVYAAVVRSKIRRTAAATNEKAIADTDATAVLSTSVGS